MKKVLLATTALVAFAGAANAEIKLSGYAEMGVAGTSSWDIFGTHVDSNTAFHNDIQFKVAMTSATDSGLEFGASVEVRDSNGNQQINGTPKFDNEQVWVSGSFGKVSLGEIDGALDWATDEIYMGSAIQDDHSTHLGANTLSSVDGMYNNQVARYEYSFGDFAVAVSAELDPSPAYSYSTTFGTVNVAKGDPVVGVGVHWAGSMSGADIALGLGYQSSNGDDAWAASAMAKMANGIQVNLGYADYNGLADKMGYTDDTWWGVGIGYTSGALLTQVNYGEYDSGSSGWGLVANYDLGGGASAQFGYGHSDSGVSYFNAPDTWSAGLALSF